MEKDSGSRRSMEMRRLTIIIRMELWLTRQMLNGEQNSQNLIGTEGNVLATERFQQEMHTQYYLYNKDIQGSTS